MNNPVLTNERGNLSRAGLNEMKQRIKAILERRYLFYQDSGHGWLEVPLEYLIRLGIENEITEYSYENMNEDGIVMVYLEEDRDMTRFIRELAEYAHLQPGDYWKVFNKMNVHEIYQNGRSPIRQYQHYVKK
jgi:hypothetical protein